MEQPEVAEAAVAAQPDRVRGEVPVAYIVPERRLRYRAALGSPLPRKLRIFQMSAALHRGRKASPQRAGQSAKAPVGSRREVKILMVASEATPFAKTGGLADVLGSLPPALVRLGDEVGVVLPKYRVAETSGAEVGLARHAAVGGPAQLLGRHSSPDPPRRALFFRGLPAALRSPGDLRKLSRRSHPVRPVEPGRAGNRAPHLPARGAARARLAGWPGCSVLADHLRERPHIFMDFAPC